jgi:signal transduction histidine kinase
MAQERSKNEVKLQELNRELAGRAEALTLANEDLASFSAAVSHDLRNPLAAISGYSYLLLHRHADRFEDKDLEAIRRISDVATGMQRLIEDLLALSRVSQTEPDIQEVDLSEIVQALLADLSAKDPDRRAEFFVEPDHHVEADRGLITIALENLVRNAWKFTSKQDVCFIWFGRDLTDPRRPYFIRDNGAGFEPKDAAKLFRPFERLHSESEFTGTGIGLNTVHRIIRKHGGTIWAEGKPGLGACFYFALSSQTRD